ncbi:hypothetical protein ACJIZ3_010318 [Penstemon smallii]|uniref:Signal recognition particle receptor subunit beta n=1 Tax=Penstemon smallii TaxID=265156 RepID=A0ABD3TGZ3_9LAMI
MDKEKLEELKIQLQQVLKEAQQFVDKIPPNQIYAAIGVVLFTIFLFLIIRLFKRKSSNTILLTGLSGSGKTVLFYQLRDGSSHQGTVTSMEPNEGTFILHSETSKKGKTKPVHIVDVPGHSRLRPKLDEFLPQAAGIVFVVDAVEFLPNVRAASEYLYDILTKASVVKRKIPVLLLCTKVDKVTAHTKDFIRKQLEKEIDKLRASRTALSSADITNEYTLGVPGETFVFSQCNNKVTIAEASGLTNDISQLEQFIREYVSVPYNSLSMVVTVRCGHCTSILSVNMSKATFVPLHFFSSLDQQEETPKQESCSVEVVAEKKANMASYPSLCFSSEDEEDSVQLIQKPPERKQRAPSAYNCFIKYNNLNWAHYPQSQYKGEEVEGSSEGSMLSDVDKEVPCFGNGFKKRKSSRQPICPKATR